MKSDHVFIVAELSANHNGSKKLAIETIRAAKRAGADAIKLQTYTADTITLNCKSDDFIIRQGTVWDGTNLYDLYKSAYTPWEWHPDLYEVAESEGIVCFSTPFDKTAVDFLESINNPIYKIASFEITDTPLIEYASKTLKPIMISTGIATSEDIELAVNCCKKMGNNDITLLKCTSSYPAPMDEANLSMITDMKNRYQVKTGLSDHTLGITAPIVGVTLGAQVIEKHLILNKRLGGPDSSFSLDEKEFTEMVKGVRLAEKALGNVSYDLTPKMKSGRELSKSIYISHDISEGEVFTCKNIKCVRPGYGLHPKYFSKILGCKSRANITKGTPFITAFVEGWS
jgi:pseudaminic acid synthase